MRKRYEVDVYTTGSETIDASPEGIQRAVLCGFPDYFVDVRETHEKNLIDLDGGRKEHA